MDDMLEGEAIGVPEGSAVVGDVAPVDMVSPSGKAYKVPRSSVQAASAKGWRIESEPEKDERLYGGTTDTVKAFGEGALRGATLGLSDLVLTKSGLVDPEVLEKRKEVNPVASGIGDITGIGASLLVPTGVGQVGAVTKLLRGVTAPTRLLAEAGTEIAARTEGKLLKYLTERGIDKALVRAGELGVKTGEVVAPGLGKQALAKAVAYGAAGVVENTAYGAAEAVSERLLGDPKEVSELLVSHIGPAAIAGGLVGGVFGALSPVATAGLGRFTNAAAGKLEDFAAERALKATGARGADIRKLGSKEKVRQVGSDLMGAELESGEKVLGAFSRADDLAPRLEIAADEAVVKLEALRGEVDAFATKKKLLPDAAAYLKRVDEEILAPLKSSDVPGVRARANAVDEELAGLRTAVESGEPVSLARLTQARKDLASIVYPKRPKGGGLPPQPPPHAADLQGAERMLEEFIEENTERVVKQMKPELAGKYAELRRNAESMIKARRLSEKADLQDLGNRWFSPTDYFTGGLAGVGSTIAGLATGNIAPMAVGALSAAGHKLLRERGSAFIATAADKTAKLRVLQKQIEITNERLNSAIVLFAGQAAQGPLGLASTTVLEDVTGKKNRKEAAKEFALKLHDYIGNPEKLATNIAGSLQGLEGTAPGLSQELSAKTAQIIASLQQHAPFPSPSSLLQPEAVDWEPTEAEAAQFSRIAAAHLNPVGVLEEALRGAADPEAVKIVREQYPGLVAVMAPKVLGAIAESKKRLRWRDKVALSIMFDVPVDPLLEPVAVRRAQQTHAPAPAPGQGNQQVRLGGLDKLNEVASMFSTRFQQTEGGLPQ